VIVAANDSWKRFADQNGAPGLATTSVGLSYHDICMAAVDQPEAGEAAAAWAGIEAVQNRSLDHYTLDYVCDAPNEQRWYRMSVYPMREPSAGTVVMHDNITQSKRTEMRLDDERTLLGTLLATIPDLVWLKDPNGVYLTCNAQFEALFGARQADIVGRTDRDFVSPAQAEEYLRGDRHAMQAGKPCLFEEWITYARDGRRALVETTRTPMLDGRGALVGVLGVARDITERHIMQQQVQQLALFDPLTHLANRRLLGDRLGQAIASCKRAGGGLAVMFIDLDNFKPINDTHGHKAGDLLLLEVARRLKGSVRETDTVARFGGQEDRRKTAGCAGRAVRTERRRN
jgi:PAS domain S-box-containing protein